MDDFLSTYPIRFQRQKAIGKFIVDFYCAKARLIIELDGGQHYTEDGLELDDQRTHCLEGMELKVLRFTNDEVLYDLSSVSIAINLAVKEALGKKSVSDLVRGNSVFQSTQSFGLGDGVS